MLQLNNITWNTPDGSQILKGITLTIPDDKLVVITGPNGSGKTTLAKIIAGLEMPESGSIIFNGKDITKCDVTERAKLGISYAFQQPIRFKGITVRDMLSLASQKPLTEMQMCQILDKVGLCAKDYLDREINASLSGGEIKRIEIATVFTRNTMLTVFDEPEAGIDLWSFSNLINVFKQLRQTLNGSLIIISHQERIIDIADEIIVIADGKLQNSGSKSSLLGTLNLNLTGCNTCPKGREVFKHE